MSEELEAIEEPTPDFGDHEEKQVLALAFENPEFFSSVMQYLTESYFKHKVSKFIFTIIKYHYDKHSVIISREMAIDIAKKGLTADDPYDEIISLIKDPMNPKDVPIVMDTLISWARNQAYNKLYQEEAIDAHSKGDHSIVDKVVEEANKIVEFKSNFFFFFKSYDSLFVKENAEHFTTGFSRLDEVLNNGGPSRGEVVNVLAPTGVGKSIFLINAGSASILDERNVLHVTCEMTVEKTCQRYLGCFTDEWIESRFVPEIKAKMRAKLEQKRETYQKQLVVVEYPPNDISVDHVHMNIDVLRRMYGIKIDVVIIDYLELLLPRQTMDFDKDYNLQKRVGTEICRLAKKEKVVVFTAMQTNRGGGADNLNSSGGDKVIELDKAAESFGKTMPMDYIISLNQNKQEYDEGKKTISEDSSITDSRCRFYIAKNRNGPKFITIGAKINYQTMKMTQHNE